MRCAAIARRTEQRCRRRIPPGQRLCCYHKDIARDRAADQDGEGGQTIYSEGMEASLKLEGAKVQQGVEEEIAMLRVVIRRMVQEGDVEAARRNIETLCRALRVQYALGGHSAEGLAGSLARVLDELRNEFGMTA